MGGDVLEGVLLPSRVCHEDTMSSFCFTLYTMSAKSLGTLAMITDELQNPLPLKIMLCEGDVNNPVGKSDVFLHD